MAIGKFYCADCGNKDGTHKMHCVKLPRTLRVPILCYASKESGCDKSAKYRVETKRGVNIQKGYYCSNCVQPYMYGDEGKKHFIVVPINN